MRYKTADPMTKKITNTLLELLTIDSDNRAEKSEIIRYAIDRLRGFGMKVEEVGDIGTPAIIATYGTGGIAFSGHLDTVPIGDGWSRKQGE
ncbi:MAG: hypothetical protein LUO84_03845, partial [Methanomassiliicoccales archaeon]|nr:hypothetical protein [Methanomassiliicoccales archaeon]